MLQTTNQFFPGIPIGIVGGISRKHLEPECWQEKNDEMMLILQICFPLFSTGSIDMGTSGIQKKKEYVHQNHERIKAPRNPLFRCGS